MKKLFYVLLSTALAATSASLALSTGLLPMRSLELKDIRHEQGLAYMAMIGTAAYSSHERHSAAQLHENSALLGPGNSLHDEIRTKGRGRFSVWHDTVYFSASDNSSPIENNRQYKLTVPWTSPRVQKLAKLSAVILWVAVMLIVAGWIWGRARKTAGVNAQNVLGHETAPLGQKPQPSKHSLKTWFLVPISLVLCLLVVEIALRFSYTTPQAIEINKLPIIWSKDVGWHYQTGEKFEYSVRRNDGQLVRAQQKVNQWGYLDREIAPSWPEEGLRIMILGDSFAEALQVNMESKVGALLETKLRKKLGRPVDILTLGCSGTGQANQYAYWRKYREAFKPHLLVLLMVENDIRDNDPELSARYHRWNPLYPPRTYFFASPKGPDGLGEVPISEIWQQHAALLESPTVVESDFLSSVSRWSKLGRFVLARTAPAKGTPWNQTYRGHQVDMAFLTPELKNDPLLKESWNLSEKVVAKYARELAGIGTRLAFMVGSVHPTSTANSGKYQVGTFYDWVANQAKANGAGYISLPDKLDALQKQSKDVCVSDGHWNEEGHALAADCLAEYILKAVPR